MPSTAESPAGPPPSATSIRGDGAEAGPPPSATSIRGDGAEEQSDVPSSAQHPPHDIISTNPAEVDRHPPLDLEQQLAAARAELQKRVEELARSERLRSSLKTATEQLQKRLRDTGQQLQRLEGENAHLLKLQAQAVPENADPNNPNHKSSGAPSKSDDERDLRKELRDVMEAAELARVKFLEQISKLQLENRVLQDAKESADHQAAGLETKVETLNTERAEQQRAWEETEALLKAQLEEKSEVNAETAAEKQQVMASAREMLQEKEETIKQKEDIIKNNLGILRAIEQDCATKMERLERDLSESKKLVEEKTEALGSLEAEFGRIESELAARVEAMSSEKTSEIERLKTGLEERESEIAALEKEKVFILEKNAIEKKELAEKEQKTVAALREELEAERDAAVEELRVNLEAERESGEEKIVQQNNAEREKLIAELENALNEEKQQALEELRRGKNGEVEQIRAACSEKVGELEGEISQLKIELEKKPQTTDDAFDALERDLESLANFQQDAHSDVHRLQETNSLLEGKVIKLAAENAELKSTLLDWTGEGGEDGGRPSWGFLERKF